MENETNTNMESPPPNKADQMIESPMRNENERPARLMITKMVRSLHSDSPFVLSLPQSRSVFYLCLRLLTVTHTLNSSIRITGTRELQELRRSPRDWTLSQVLLCRRGPQR